MLRLNAPMQAVLRESPRAARARRRKAAGQESREVPYTVFRGSGQTRVHTSDYDCMMTDRLQVKMDTATAYSCRLHKRFISFIH